MEILSTLTVLQKIISLSLSFLPNTHTFFLQSTLDHLLHSFKMSSKLPMELWEKIWESLNVPDRVMVQRVCKDWHGYSIASKRLWKDMLHIRDDQSVNADTKLDYSILKQITGWTDDMHFDQLSITLRCDTAQQSNASFNFLEMLPSTEVRDLVLGSGEIGNDSQLSNWTRLYGVRMEKIQQCMNMRSLIMNLPAGSMPRLATKVNVTPTPLEILSISMKREHYHGPFVQELQGIRIASSFQESDAIRQVVKGARAIDLIESQDQICDRFTISFLGLAASTLEYLTINIVSATAFEPSLLPSETTIIHFPNLRFFALEADDLRKDAVKFNCPNLQSLQVSHVPNLEIFKPCPPLQSLYIKGKPNDESEYWKFLELIPNENLRNMFVRTSPYLFCTIVNQVHNKSALPNLQKLVVIGPIPSLSEQAILALYGPSSSIKHKLRKLIWQCVGMSREDENKEKNGLEFILKYVAEKFIRYNVNPDFPDLATYQFSPTILEEFAEYRNVMEKRKLFFDGNVIRKDFLFSRSTTSQT
ncbi:uncharacterized protein FA14DRAFT_32685 [Meira miltonrushii]|uniref:F-box domain-containing protein n=1 Tax=Meira miltonrushii TaxID=1280837 RepID=A0A316VGP0_9BASI|nr:uncharacterized protein FA14DRAFT_32685 [Meira miltonrushii]PWN34665.1 hypothetical protein FA14DRAFT_32685 [Meira miltonrushii]